MSYRKIHPVDENDLIERLQAEAYRDTAFRELIHLYKERLYWHIRKIVVTHTDTDDVLQNTFIKVFQNIHKFKGQSKLFSWMYRIATNEALTFVKRRSKHLHISEDEYHSRLIDNLEADVYFEGDAFQLKLQRAIATLPERQRLVFNMKYFDELKYREMAEILEITEGALKASYHLAVKKIEEYITEH